MNRNLWIPTAIVVFFVIGLFSPLISLWEFIQAGDGVAVVAVVFSAVFTPLVVGAFRNYVLPRSEQD